VTGREATNKALVSDDLEPVDSCLALPLLNVFLYSLIPTSLLLLIAQSKHFMVGGPH
jgi:hypothetical protein